ncbi:MAG: hypothetical protein ACI97N_002344 [Cognaticolwellia sp.]|jgi:hypothetical protein|tara:strand:- start:923 stop:1033 length:111 start_codon:yes stop_codon:yes gene_type:complete
MTFGQFDFSSKTAAKVRNNLGNLESRKHQKFEKIIV